MALERMGVQPFFTEEIGKQSVPGRVFAKPPRRAKKTYRYNRHGGKPRGTRRRIKLPSSLAVKIGVCVAACALMLGLKELDVPVAAQMVSGVRDAVNEEQNLAEMLGKLQFVELPRALEVCSDNSRL
ncbi:MAG: hypothetical protein LBS18_08440 [Clostridiales bacterium]|jgi:hypothetical protein|nr:hypothetical protein [Clostridiales bacterium]